MRDRAGGHDEVLHTMRLFGEQIIPHFRHGRDFDRCRGGAAPATASAGAYTVVWTPFWLVMSRSAAAAGSPRS